jgi:hypothetical protein
MQGITQMNMGIVKILQGSLIMITETQLYTPDDIKILKDAIRNNFPALLESLPEDLRTQFVDYQTKL